MKLETSHALACIAVALITGCATETASRSRDLAPASPAYAERSSPPAGSETPAAVDAVWNRYPASTPLEPARVTAAEEPKPLSELMVKVADVEPDEPITPDEFRSPPGARFMWFEF